jgi:membrane associated rhomboid family serine protease
MTEAHPAEGAAATAPTCYRHPERETYIRCSRCDKPICPECMVSAAVGFQCPDCVAEGRRTQRPVKTVFGGDVHPRSNVVTISIIAVCVAVFGLQVAYPAVTGKFSLVGVDVAAGQWYRLITCGFLHVSVLHILFNMWALWVVGPPLEGVFGRLRFSAIYFVSLLCGSAASYLFGNPLAEALGASGAIFGLFGALFVVARRMRWNAGGIAALIVINLLLPFVMPSIDWHAHVGGLVGGVAAGAVMAYAPQRWRALASVGACVVLVAVCVVMVGARTNQLTNSPVYAPYVQQGVEEPDFRPSVQ